MHIYHIHIKGLVQGVGFRPFIYRIAHEMKLSGEIKNNNEGVCVEIEATEENKNNFLKRVLEEKPMASEIDTIDIRKEPHQPYRKSFAICKSENISEKITRISPDIAVCPECLKDMRTQQNRLYYPFVNCTNCGPRFTIIDDLPYDRKKTSMNSFNMCPDCFDEYTDILNRRFHAQPTACNECGPYYFITAKTESKNSEKHYSDPECFFKTIAQHVKNGEIIPFKGLGGYNLICDAFNPNAVSRMREIKSRDAKPFALMFRSEEKATRYVHITEEESRQLNSWKRPIVLMELISNINPDINDGLKTIGIMLPYLPAHYLLFDELETDALIFTSGNLSDEPIITSNIDAEDKLLPFCHIQADHNRDIVNRTDDSVLQVINRTPRVMRRSRGFVPTSHTSSLYLDGIFAAGAEKVNTFAVGKGHEAILSQYIGDLKNKETFDFYTETFCKFQKLFRFSPTLIACDLHPDYFSTRNAGNLAEQAGIPIYQIQHHHAHAVSCMEENHLSGNHIAVILDGTGYGTDGKIWGGEIFISNHLDFERVDHYDYISLPGGDKSVKEPWRTATAFLDHYGLTIPTSFVNKHESDIELIRKMCRQKINAPMSCGAGRIFDAASALLNCCHYASYQAEAPLKLEHLCADNYKIRYPIDEKNPLNNFFLFESLLDDLNAGVSKDLIAAKFHNTIVEQLITRILQIRKERNLPKEIILSGGCFQNKRLSEELEKRIIKEGLIPVTAKKYPANDGGVALGQIAIAAALRQQEYA